MRQRLELKFINAKDALPLRHRFMRPLDPIEACMYPEDNDPSTVHVGLFHTGRLVSVATFMLESHPKLHAGCPYRLRGMATDDKDRGHGFGGKLVRFGIEALRERRCDLIWFNAREKAFSFYSGLGFKFFGEMFDIPRIGRHKVMYKHVNPR